MKLICPTITVDSLEDFKNQFAVASKLSTRVHIDLADGLLAPRKLIDPELIEDLSG